ncbi:PIN domain-containing protein [Clavibacter tessellarius]|uniref:PIN domain-containing protein n=1 Tax=Clavibacter tessellarius TaxID=31965 RepID=UPI0039E97F16
MAIHAYPDSNAFYSDRFLRRPYSAQFVEMLDEEGIDVILSPIVVLESKRHARDKAKEAIKALNRAIRSAEHETQIDGLTIKRAADDLQGPVLEKAGSALSPILTHPSAHTLAMPTISGADLVKRELDRRRPFLDKPAGSIGLRDMLIWQNLLETVDPDVDDIYLFITKDKGFLDQDQTGLHDDLLEDLDELGIPRDMIRIVPDLARATVEARRLADLISERSAQIEQLLISYANYLGEYQWGMHFDPQDGGLVDGETQPATLPWYLEDPMVTSAEYLETISIEEGAKAECVALYAIDFDAQISAQEYFSGDYPDLEWWHGDVDEHYIGVHTTRKVRISYVVNYNAELREGDVEDISFEWV